VKINRSKSKPVAGGVPSLPETDGGFIPVGSSKTSDLAYQRLAKHLDDLPGGFPATESGVEQRIVRRLFTPEEAELAVHLELIEESPRVVAYRAGLPVEKTAEMLEEMALKGLIVRLGNEGNYTYLAMQFIIGIWEFQVGRLTPGLIKDFNEYAPYITQDDWYKHPQLRTIPVEKSIDLTRPVMGYETASKIIKKQKKIVVAPCICRREHRLIGEGCGKLEEACLLFGEFADYYEKNGIGREIDAEEAVALLEVGQEQGLVCQPTNAKNPVSMCLCCGCCCQVLKALKRHNVPSEGVASPFFVKVDEGSCVGCKICVKRCPMDAVKVEEKMACIDKNRCIGCGVCVTTCPKDSISLERKSNTPSVPWSFKYGALLDLGKARGKISNLDVVKVAVKSKVDRLLAPDK
jgi:Pyruvate/2-oxoacid:ferredoxin oxidoreductase delta subunit